jgi:hypothetical protein
MARHRRGKRGYGKKNRAIPVAPILPLAGVLMNDFKSGVNAANANTFTEDITGYNMSTGKFSIAQAAPFWGGEIVGIVVHKVASKTRLNQYIRKFTMGYLEL